MSNVADTNGPPATGTQPLVLHGRDVSCRVQPWSYQPQTAQIVFYEHRRMPHRTDLEAWSAQLSQLGFNRVRTSAVRALFGPHLESAGFHVLEELVLLAHDDPRNVPRSGLPTRRMLVSDRTSASTVDRAAFGDEWALDERSIGDVCAATARHRARAIHEPLAGYAITGRDGRQGFVQRLAVHPDHRRRGLGRAFVLDSLHWLARWRVQRVLVNTPVHNSAALQLYSSLGFRRLPEALRVYERSLT